MIFDRLPNADRYFPLHPLFEKSFAYLRSFTPDIADGRYELEGEALVAMVQTYESKVAAERRYEAHQRYLDIQYMLSGDEYIFYAPIEETPELVAYDPVKDVTRLGEPQRATQMVAKAGDFAIFYPEDAHKPSCSIAAPVTVRKIVLKVEIPR